MTERGETEFPGWYLLQVFGPSRFSTILPLRTMLYMGSGL